MSAAYRRHADVHTQWLQAPLSNMHHILQLHWYLYTLSHQCENILHTFTLID